MPTAHTIFYYITIVIVLLFPAAILHINHGGSTTFVILALLGIITPFIKRYRPFSHEEKRLFYVLGLFFAVFLVSLIINGSSREGLKKIELYGKLLFAIPFLYLLLRVRTKEAIVWYGITCGSFLAGLWGLYEAYTLGLPPAHRVHSATHFIIYGDLSLAMAFMSLAGIGYFRQRSRFLVLLPISAFLMGFIGSILSGTRGAWIAVPALIVLLLWYYWDSLTKLKRIAIISILAVLPFIIYTIPQTGVEQRLNQAYDAINTYQQSGNARSSAGSRLEMWKAAWNIFLENPLIGAGPGNFQHEAQKLVDKGIYHEVIAWFNHPHNEYLNVLCTRGLLGLFGLLALFLVPGKYLFNAMNNDNKSISRFGFAGMILIISYMHFALTEAILDRSPPLLFFTFFLTLFTYHVSSLSRPESGITD